MTRTLTYDVVVLGAGAVGENVADRAGRTGLSVVVVEAELVGGECSYWACMPSKALLRPGAALAAARDVGGAAQAVTGTLDVAAVLARRDSFAGDWDDAGQVQWLEGAGIALVRGQGRLAGPRVVEVETDDGVVRIAARCAVVVATGSEPVVPDVPGLAESAPWTSREATSVQDVPGSVAVLGGGVVGVEMATALADLGSRVTLLVRGERVLGAAEPFASDAVVASLRELGVEVRLRTSVTQVARDDAGFRVTTSHGELAVDQLLVATGRRPRTDEIGLETIGLTPGGPLEVDDALAVQGVDGGWLFAVGDVTGRVATTHQGKYDARVAGDVVATRFAARAGDGAGPADGPAGGGEADGGGQVPGAEDPAPWSAHRATADHQAQPQVVFTRPEVAWVGLTEAAAREAGHPVRTVQVALRSAAGTGLLGDHADGTAQLVLHAERGTILGATFVGPDVAELLHAATVAVVGEVPLTRLWHAVPAYPTVSEVWLRLLEAAGL